MREEGPKEGQGPRLAILTVVRDDRAGLADSFASLASQLGPEVAWLVADGASTDGTAQWLAERAGVPLWWRSAPDSGLYDAMNRLLAAARRAGCGHALFLNAGDRLAAPDTAARLLRAAAEHPDAALLYGDALERQADGRIHLKRARSHRRAFLGMFTHHQAMLYRLDSLDGLSFDPRFAVAADYAFTLAALARGPAVRLPAALCLFAPGGLSQRRAGQGRREQALIRRALLGHGPLRESAITAAQWAAMALRRWFPVLYAKLRFRCPAA